MTSKNDIKSKVLEGRAYKIIDTGEKIYFKGLTGKDMEEIFDLTIAECQKDFGEAFLKRFFTPEEFERIKEKFKPFIAHTPEEFKKHYEREIELIDFDINLLKKLSEARK